MARFDGRRDCGTGGCGGGRVGGREAGDEGMGGCDDFEGLEGEGEGEEAVWGGVSVRVAWVWCACGIRWGEWRGG